MNGRAGRNSSAAVASPGIGLLSSLLSVAPTGRSGGAPEPAYSEAALLPFSWVTNSRFSPTHLRVNWRTSAVAAEPDASGL